MRLNYDATHDMLDKLLASLDEMREARDERVREAYSYWHPSTHSEPGWFSSKGDAHMAAAVELDRVNDWAQDWFSAVYDYAESDGFKGVAPRAFAHVFSVIASAEEYM